jgi:hypothetical protein
VCICELKGQFQLFANDFKSQGYLSFYRGIKSNHRHCKTGRQKTVTKVVSEPSQPPSSHISVLWSLSTVAFAILCRFL